MLTPSCKPRDWALRRVSCQPRLWEGSKVRVIMTAPLWPRVVDACHTLTRKVKVKGAGKKTNTTSGPNVGGM